MFGIFGYTERHDTDRGYYVCNGLFDGSELGVLVVTRWTGDELTYTNHWFAS